MPLYEESNECARSSRGVGLEAPCSWGTHNARGWLWLTLRELDQGLQALALWWPSSDLSWSAQLRHGVHEHRPLAPPESFARRPLHCQREQQQLHVSPTPAFMQVLAYHSAG